MPKNVACRTATTCLLDCGALSGSRAATDAPLCLCGGLWPCPRVPFSDCRHSRHRSSLWGATSVSTALMYICTAMKLWKQAAALSRNFTPANITRDTAANVVSLLAVVWISEWACCRSGCPHRRCSRPKWRHSCVLNTGRRHFMCLGLEVRNRPSMRRRHKQNAHAPYPGVALHMRRRSHQLLSWSSAPCSETGHFRRAPTNPAWIRRVLLRLPRSCEAHWVLCTQQAR